MSDSKAGNVEAIRDWSKRYFYTKSDVGEFFTKLNTGLMAYKLKIISKPYADITITEDALTNPQIYHITTYEDGRYDGLFFFHDQCTLTFTTISGNTVVTPSSYVEEIEIDVTNVNLSNFTILRESDMQVSVAANLFQSVYSSGVFIGCFVYSPSKIDVTNFNTLKYDLALTNCYGGGVTCNPNFKFGAGLIANTPSSSPIPTYTALDYKNTYEEANSSYTEEELDISAVTGEYYIGFAAPGWSSEVSNVYLL